MSLGDSPTLSLKEARNEADARKSIAKDSNANLAQAQKDMQLAKAQGASIVTFREVTEAWLALKTTEWTGNTYKDAQSPSIPTYFPSSAYCHEECYRI